ncbi:hypothetical protein NE236_03625 [Actinoallomurus purpureus]|uniref:hypothetical protein n=1 Tax=Actinoallomurus purpureus TaxID=478114 RepID=UPI002092DA2C|nr:hypothetical protein [Actinoallomurus purpureus]MCO6004059.1 hypothetical protein [Actinoallomurus purpureus]
MCDIEYHTVCYMRDILVTPSHRDPVVTAFMTMWNVEEFWHGEALAAVLGMHAVHVGHEHLAAVRRDGGWRDRLDPIKQSLLANIVGDDFVAVHMAWGAVNEWSAIAAYKRLAVLEDHPVLSALLERIVRQESRHVAFYATQARDRLARSEKARRLTRFALRRFWAPVGSGVMPEAAVRQSLRHLMSGPDGRRAAHGIDAHLQKLPGLANLHIVEAALDSRGIV